MLHRKVTNKQVEVRDSGIELMKIIAIILIVISHVVQTLVSENSYLTYRGYIINVSNATTNIQTIILLILRHLGVLGNSLFFVCSAWFLLKSSAFKKKKWFSMLTEIWTVSIIILIITCLILHQNISKDILIKSFFPTMFSNNWYMTCYLLFYPIHPMLNVIVKHMNRTKLLRVTICLSILCVLFDFIKGDLFFSSPLILWVTIYFMIAYMQKYMSKFANSLRLNIRMIMINTIFFIGIILLTEFCGLHLSQINGKMARWNNNSNPFLIFIAIALFNIARNIHFKNTFINYISSLSLLIYIITENLILRTYYRPAIWNYIYTHYGYSNVVGWVFIITVIVFLFGVFSGAIYTGILSKVVLKISDELYLILRKKYLFLESNLMKMRY